jgi:membrane AbrB-like protein
LRSSVGVSWAVLIGLTGVLTVGMRLAHIPAALMLGPMLSAIVVALVRPGAKLPKASTVVAQAVMGCLIAHALSPHLLVALAPQWPILLGMNLAVMLGISALGLVVTRLQWLPGTAGIWGMSPGGAGAMVLLAEAYGGDKRLVAVMQYLRLLCAALAVVAIGSLLGQPHAANPAIALPGGPATPWLAPIRWPNIGMMLGLSALAVVVSIRLRRPTLVLFVPIFGGIAVQVAGWPVPDVPPLLSAAAFALVGWHIGLSFTRESLMHSLRLVPRILAGIAAILLLCLALAALLAKVAHVSFLTAYMALNPGGADVVLVMAANISVDLPLILAMQISRVILVIAIAPALGRMAAGYHLGTVEEPDSAPEDGADQLAEDVDSVL